MKESVPVPAAGYRNYNNNGRLNNIETNGYCWLSVPNSANNGYYLNFNSSNVNPQNNNNRANGCSVRPCRSSEPVVRPLSWFALTKTPEQHVRAELHIHLQGNPGQGMKGLL